MLVKAHCWIATDRVWMSDLELVILVGEAYFGPNPQPNRKVCCTFNMPSTNISTLLKTKDKYIKFAQNS